MDDSVSLFKYCVTRVLQCVLLTYFALKSYHKNRDMNRIPDNIKIEKAYQGQKILLLALYETEHVRPDISRFLKAAKHAGLYVIGINTASITDDLNDLFDCYIERANIGRDFGSYKAGFQYLFAKGYDRICPRVLMLNDSVYYESKRSLPFLETMVNTDREVLGATENFEKSHHLGSFCISIAQSVLQSKGFQDYWKHYECSDIRLIVIEKGEAALSRVLRQCVSSPAQWAAFYSMLYVDKLLSDNKTYIDDALRLARRASYDGWSNNTLMHSADDIISSQESCYVRGHILDDFRRGSQIHQNNAFLLQMGLPLVKLDGVYRGMFSKKDVAIIGSLMSPAEAAELESLLLSKPFWGDTVTGVRRWLFILEIL